MKTTKTKYIVLKFWKISRITLLFCYSIFANAQDDYLKPYIPYDSCDFDSHPIINIKLWIHIIQKSAKEPKNLTIDSIKYLDQQYYWINSMYSNLKPPTLKNSNDIYYVKDSRIRFLIDTITFHTDSIGWDRIKRIPEDNSNRWMKILAINKDSNSLEIAGIRDQFSMIKDSILIVNSLSNNGVYKIKKLVRKGPNTLLFIKGADSISSDTSGYITYYKKIDKNCHKDNWTKFTSENKDYIHIFYTGSSASVPTFGCGPSPYYLNISGIINGGGYASAQLTAHEIGHCLGLRHTNRPQFSDLPSSDKFGWLKCNTTSVSNNIMGYNNCRNYLSPLQIASIHYKYSKNKDLYRTLAHSDNNEKTIIKKPTVWNKNILAKQKILIKKNQSLTIQKQLIIPNDGVIILEKNSQLIIDNGKVHCPNIGWNGVENRSSKVKIFKKWCKNKKKGSIIFRNNGTIIY